MFSLITINDFYKGFPGRSVVKNSPAHAGDTGSIPELVRSPGDGSGNPLQYSCLGNPMDRGAWRATVHGVAQVRHDLVTQPSSSSFIEHLQNSLEYCHLRGIFFKKNIYLFIYLLIWLYQVLVLACKFLAVACVI